MKNEKYLRFLEFLFTKCLELNWIATLGLEVSVPFAEASHLRKWTMNESAIEWIFRWNTVRRKSLGQMYRVWMIWRHCRQTSSHRIKSFSSRKSKMFTRTSSTRSTERTRWLDISLKYLIQVTWMMRIFLGIVRTWVLINWIGIFCAVMHVGNCNGD